MDGKSDAQIPKLFNIIKQNNNMYKIIITFFCVLLGFVACRSGKEVMQVQKDDKNRVNVSINKVKNNTNDTAAQEEINEFLSNLREENKRKKSKELSAVQIQEQNNKFIRELNNNGIAYRDGTTKATRITKIPTAINDNFPNIMLYFEENIIGQPSYIKNIGFIYNDSCMGALPHSFNRLYKVSSKIDLKSQLNAIISVSEYPFPSYIINEISAENLTIENLSSSFNYKSIGSYKNNNCIFRLSVMDNTIQYIAIFINDKIIFAFPTTL